MLRRQEEYLVLEREWNIPFFKTGRKGERTGEERSSDKKRIHTKTI